MTTTLIATQPDDLRCLLPWARTIAAASETELAIVLPQRGKGSARLVLLPDQAGDDESDLTALCRRTLSQSASSESVSDAGAAKESLTIRMYQFAGDSWASQLPGHLSRIEPSVILAAAPAISRDQTESDDWQTVLLAGTECEVILIQADSVAFEQTMRLAVVLRNGFDNECVLRQAARLAAAEVPVRAVAVYIEPHVGDLSVSVGMQQLDRLLHQALNRYERDVFERRIIVSESF